MDRDRIDEVLAFVEPHLPPAISRLQRRIQTAEYEKTLVNWVAAAGVRHTALGPALTAGRPTMGNLLSPATNSSSHVCKASPKRCCLCAACADGDAGVGSYWGELRRTARVTWPELRALLSDHRWSATTEHDIRASRQRGSGSTSNVTPCSKSCSIYRSRSLTTWMSRTPGPSVISEAPGRCTRRRLHPRTRLAPTHRRPGPVHRLRTHRCRPRTRDLVGISVPDAAAWSRCASAGSLSSVWHDRGHDLTTRRPGPDLAR
jgi:hypothetical protein